MYRSGPEPEKGTSALFKLDTKIHRNMEDLQEDLVKDWRKRWNKM